MKDKKIAIRVSQEQWNTIHDKASKAKLSLTDYIVKCCLGKRIVVIDELKNVVRQQSAIGNNLNQLTALAHKGKIEVVDLNEMKQDYVKISQLLEDLMERRRWSSGNS